MIKPIGDYYLILPDKIEDKTESGIILPEMKKDKPQTGILVDGVERWIVSGSEPILKIGMKLWFKMWAGEPVKYEGKEYLLIHKKDIIAYEGGEK